MRGDRGTGTLLASLVMVLVLGLAVAVAEYGAVRAVGVRLQGAADLAAIAGAQAMLANSDACDSARASAAANIGTVTTCRVEGDEIEFVVTIILEEPAGLWPVGSVGTLHAHANAGVVTGAPG